MKRWRVLSAFFLFLIVLLSLSVVSAAYPSGVIAHWDFEGDLVDNSGNGNTLTNNGISFVPGKIGQAGSFVTSERDYGRLNDISDFSNLKTTGFTVGAWVKFDKDSDPDGVGTNSDGLVFLRGSGGSALNFFYLRRSTGADSEFVNKLVFASSSSPNDFLHSSSSLSNNQWHYITATWDPATQKKTIYVNCLEETNSIKNLPAVQSPLLIGVDIDSTGMNDYLDGYIDEAVIFNRVLSNSEISQLCNVPPGPSPNPGPNDYQCAENQRILRLSAQSNAHGEVYNGAGNYPIEICYDEIFGSTHTGANPHSCASGNTVLKLASNTNAHAEGPTGTNYNTNVCYGNLACTIRQNTCQGQEREVLRLSSQNNAHLAVAGTSGYNYLLCCSSGGVSPCIPGDGQCPAGCSLPSDTDCTITQCGVGQTLCSDGVCKDECGTEFTCNNNGICDAGEGCECSDCFDRQDSCAPGLICNRWTEDCRAANGIIKTAYWANNAEAKISTLNLNTQGNVVKMIVNTENIAAGTEITFEIFDEDIGVDQPIRTGTNALKASVSNNKAIATWTISDDDLDTGLGDRQYYFNASIVGSSNISNFLDVSGNIVSGSNSPPIAEISRPAEDGEVYFLCNDIEFNQTSYDPDGDALTYKWSIGEQINSNLEGQRSFKYRYTQGGQKEINLKVTDSSGLFSNSERKLILVLPNEPGVFAYINKPEHQGTVLGLAVNYSGEGSFVLNSTGAPNFEVTCLGGDCPDMTTGVKCDGSNQVVTINQNGKRGDYSAMNFTWTFTTDDNSAQKVLSGVGKSEGTRVYTKYGSNAIELLVQAYGSSASTKNLFNIARENGCLNGVIWVDPNDPLGTPQSTNQPDVCNIPGWPDQQCCPSGSRCVERGGEHVCETASCNTLTVNDEQIDNCVDYNDAQVDALYGTIEEQCKADCNNVGDNGPTAAQIPTGYKSSNKGCVWIEETSKCGFEFVPLEENTGNRPSGGSNFGCVESVLYKSECTNGYLTIQYVINKTQNGRIVSDPTSSCGVQPGPQTIPCGRPAIALPFFGAAQFGIALVVLVIVYLVIYRKKIFKHK